MPYQIRLQPVYNLGSYMNLGLINWSYRDSNSDYSYAKRALYHLRDNPDELENKL